jgi:hypothetical protein
VNPISGKEEPMQTKKILGGAAAVAALGAGTDVALAGGSISAAATGSTQSRLDDGQDLLPQAKISEQAAIKPLRAQRPER